MTTNTNTAKADTRCAGITKGTSANIRGRRCLSYVTPEWKGSLVTPDGKHYCRQHANQAPSVTDETTTPTPEAKPAATTNARTSHADCSHASSKLARAICRRERAKAASTN